MLGVIGNALGQQAIYSTTFSYVFFRSILLRLRSRRIVLNGFV